MQTLIKATLQLAQDAESDFVEKTMEVKWIDQNISPDPQVGFRIKTQSSVASDFPS